MSTPILLPEAYLMNKYKEYIFCKRKYEWITLFWRKKIWRTCVPTLHLSPKFALLITLVHLYSITEKLTVHNIIIFVIKMLSRTAMRHCSLKSRRDCNKRQLKCSPLTTISSPVTSGTLATCPEVLGTFRAVAIVKTVGVCFTLKRCNEWTHITDAS